MGFTEHDFDRLIDMHMFHYRRLIGLGGFSATAQAATVAIGGGNLTDPGQIRAVAIAVLIIALCVIVLFAASIRHVCEHHSWIVQAQQETGKSWRPHSEVLMPMTWGLLMLNVSSAIAAVAAIFRPNWFVVGT